MKRFERVEFIDDIQPGDYVGDGIETGIVLSRAQVGKFEGFRVQLLASRAESFMLDDNLTTAARLTEVAA